MENVDRIMKTGYENIGCVPVFDWKSDLFKREEFFNGKAIPAIKAPSIVQNPARGCKYYEQFTEEDRRAFLEQLMRARDHYFNNINHKDQENVPTFFYYLVGIRPQRYLFHCISMCTPFLIPYTGSCIPGRKLFVDVDGNFHVCEKISYAFPVGNVEKGLDIERISKFIDNFNDHMDKCPDCKVSRLCDHCYVHFAINKEFLYSSEVCKKIESSTKRSLIETFEIAEKYPEFVEEAEPIYKNIKKYYGD